MNVGDANFSRRARSHDGNTSADDASIDASIVERLPRLRPVGRSRQLGTSTCRGEPAPHVHDERSPPENGRSDRGRSGSCKTAVGFGVLGIRRRGARWLRAWLVDRRGIAGRAVSAAPRDVRRRAADRRERARVRGGVQPLSSEPRRRRQRGHALVERTRDDGVAEPRSRQARDDPPAGDRLGARLQPLVLGAGLRRRRQLGHARHHGRYAARRAEHRRARRHRALPAHPVAAPVVVRQRLDRRGPGLRRRRRRVPPSAVPGELRGADPAATRPRAQASSTQFSYTPAAAAGDGV